MYARMDQQLAIDCCMKNYVLIYRQPLKIWTTYNLYLYVIKKYKYIIQIIN